MKRLRHRLSLCALLFVSISSWAQSNPQTKLSLNRAPLRYFSALELDAMEQENPTHYAALLYYFTASFSVQAYNCEGCEVDYTTFYNYYLFNIKEHESLRLNSESYSFVYRDKFLVSLHPETELRSAMGMGLEQAMRKDLRPLPVYTDSGNPELDYANYTLEMKRWKLDFPEAYREISARSSVAHIPLQEFINLPEARKNDLNTRPNSYLLID